MLQKNTQKINKCYHCGKEIVDNRQLVEKKIPLSTKRGIRNYRRVFHIDCVPKYYGNLDTESETRKEQTDWEMCYELFRGLLGVKEDVNLPKHAVMRLQGLRIGQFIPNGQNTRALERGYSFEVILNTMRYSSPAIIDACKNKTFKDETHQINYCMTILISNINFIYKRMKAKERATDRLDKETVSASVTAPYKGESGMGRVQELLKEVGNKKEDDDEYWDSLFM